MTKHLTQALLLSLLLGALTAGRAPAATRFVDGACASSGDGSTLTCGPNGPFRTISDGISAMDPGDTLDIRGPHGSFDGVYKEYVGVWGTKTDAFPGKALTCTSGSPCVVQGCPASACGSDEMPTITGLVHRTDWNDRGGGVYSRVMEARSEYIGSDTPGSTTNPVQILQGPDLTALTQLRYAGNNNATPPEGTWSFNTATNVAYVNPTGSGNPNADVQLWVPDQMGVLTMQGDVNACPSTPNCPESEYVTFRRLTFAGSRWMGVLLWPASAPNYKNGINLDGIVVRYIPRFGINPYRHQNFVWNNITVEQGARGVSVNPSGFGGGFGLRTANNNGGGVISNVTVRHYGQAGQLQGTSYDYGGIECQWCDAPWNDKTANYVSSNGLGFDLKWSTGVAVSNVTCEDVSWTCLQLDTVNNVTVDGLNLKRARYGVRVLEYPSPPFTRLYNVVVRNGVIDTVGFNDGGGVLATPISPLNAGEFGFQLHHLQIAHTSYAGISVEGADRVSLWNNTIVGVNPFLGIDNPPDGIKTIGTVTNLDLRNNIITAVTGDGIDVSAATTAQAPTLDYDVLYAGGPRSCAVRWGATCYSSLAAFKTAVGRESHGVEADPLFANPAGLDLRLCQGSETPLPSCTTKSPCIDAGASVGLTFSGAAPDAGAIEVGAATTTPQPPTLLEVLPLK